MAALDPINIAGPDLPTGDDVAQKRLVRSVGKKVGQREIDLELGHHLVEGRRDVARRGSRRVFLAVGREDGNRLAVVKQMVRSVLAGYVGCEPVGTARDDFQRM